MEIQARPSFHQLACLKSPNISLPGVGLLVPHYRRPARISICERERDRRGGEISPPIPIQSGRVLAGIWPPLDGGRQVGMSCLALVAAEPSSEFRIVRASFEVYQTLLRFKMGLFLRWGVERCHEERWLCCSFYFFGCGKGIVILGSGCERSVSSLERFGCDELFFSTLYEENVRRF